MSHHVDLPRVAAEVRNVLLDPLQSGVHVKHGDIPAKLLRPIAEYPESAQPILDGNENDFVLNQRLRSVLRG